MAGQSSFALFISSLEGMDVVDWGTGQRGYNRKILLVCPGAFPPISISAYPSLLQPRPARLPLIWRNRSVALVQRSQGPQVEQVSLGIERVVCAP